MADDAFTQLATRFPAGCDVRVVSGDGMIGALLDSPLAAPVYGKVLRVTADAAGTPMVGVFLGGFGEQLFAPDELERGRFESRWVEHDG